MDEERKLKKAEELGAWITDTEFEFFMPVVLGPGMIAKRIDVSHFMSTEDINPDEIVEALGNQMMSEPIPCGPDDLVYVSCPDCERKGALPKDMLPVDYKGDALVRCPQCRKAAMN